ncbi:hypothetical protein IFR05_005745 [Cadophora sp. M221]|nr:hypothetical protein IFR05_005745 [Cadophora sp. M221]
MQAPTTFRRFNSLPPELRLEVWNFACIQEGQSSPTVRKIAKDYFRQLKDLSEPLELRILARTSFSVPPLLQTCKYSREVALKHWSQWPCARPRVFDNDGTKVYVNKEHDIFYFAQGGLSEFWILSSFVGYRIGNTIGYEHNPMPVEDRLKAKELWRKCISVIKQFAVNWYCWLEATNFSDWSWMEAFGINNEGDLSIVIMSRIDPPCVPKQRVIQYLLVIPRRVAPYSEPQPRTINPGTIRARAVDAILNHVKNVGIGEVFPSDTQTVKLRREADKDHCAIPMLKGLAVCDSEASNDEDSTDGDEYFEFVTRQAKYHRVQVDLRRLRKEEQDLGHETPTQDWKHLDIAIRQATHQKAREELETLRNEEAKLALKMEDMRIPFPGTTF